MGVAVTKNPISNCILFVLKNHIFWTVQDIIMKLYMRLEDEKLKVLVQFCAILSNGSAVIRD